MTTGPRPRRSFDDDAIPSDGGIGHELRIDTTKGHGTVSNVEVLPEKENIRTMKVKVRARPPDDDYNDKEVDVDVDDRNDHEEYVPRWARSSKRKQSNNDEEGTADPNGLVDKNKEYIRTDDLPLFADDETRELHQEIKTLERRRDEAASTTRSHNERIITINEHLRNIRQEIDHTNSLVAAKKSEVETEEHMLSLSQRELGKSLRDISELENINLTTQANNQSVWTQIKRAEEELEKLKTTFNLNQEELEQWATAATKRDEESLALQKFALVDELKIEELILTIEDLTKRLLEKKSLLENEVTETRSNQTELDKIAERFKSRHEERRQYLQQWKDTIESMKNRDEAINDLAVQYARIMKLEEDHTKSRQMYRDQLALLENERESLQKDIDNKERLLQTKRQEYSSQRESENSLRDEVNSLRIEMSTANDLVESKRAEYKAISKELQEKQQRIGSLSTQLDEIRKTFEKEKFGTNSSEQTIEAIEESLSNREKELKQADKNIAILKKNLFNNTKRLNDLRKREKDLMSEIQGTVARIKSCSSKKEELENRQTKQQELFSNVSFQLEQMERKVARGLGERSNEEQEQLKAQIKSLEESLESHTKKKNSLAQQKRKLQVELRTWDKKLGLSESKYNETVKMIEANEVQIVACEHKLKGLVTAKEDATVAHEVTVLEVRRLRDSLRNLLEAIFCLKDEGDKSSTSMQEKKEEMIKLNERKKSDLRISKEERHKLVIELGKAKAGLEKTKAKYCIISATDAGKRNGDAHELPELKLILAAQRREELKQEGDKLDATIQRKEEEIRAMKETVAQLRSENNNLRSSFSRADANGAKMKELKDLAKKTQSTEESLLRVKRELQNLQKQKIVKD